MKPSRILRRIVFTAWLAFVMLLLAAPIVAADRLPRLDQTNLLIYRNERGDIVPVKSRSDWQKRRASVLQGMQEVMGPLPGKEKRCPLDVQVEEEVDCGSYVRRFITYASEPNARVPAYLLIPKKALSAKKKFPAVLCRSPHAASFRP